MGCVILEICHSVCTHVTVGYDTVDNKMVFRVTGHLYGEFTGDRRIPRTKASDAELWYFIWYVPE